MSIIDQIELTPSVKARAFRDALSHWNKLAKILYAENNEINVLTYLRAEAEGKNRHYIVNRIYAHYNALRRKRELREIIEWSQKRQLRGTLTNESENLED